ncbi:hypothetical protein Plhal703r1_c01g0006361 [Plasmopara halstedii]
MSNSVVSKDWIRSLIFAIPLPGLRHRLWFGTTSCTGTKGGSASENGRDIALSTKNLFTPTDW